MGKEKFHIHITEDNPADARLVQESLKGADGISFETTVAGCVEDTLQNLRNEAFDALLLDLDLPDSRGLETLERVIKEFPGLPVIVLTGNTEGELGLKAIQKHASDYLVKGKIDADLLIRSITYAIERKFAEEELNKLNRTLRALSDSSQAMMRAENEPDYLKEVCRIIVGTCNYAMVWIGYKQEDETKTVRPMAQAGFDEGYIESMNIVWDDSERGRGPTGTAIRTGKTTMCRNMLTDPKFEPWRKEAIKRGYASSIAISLATERKIFGVITIYSREPDPFSEDEVRLLEELAGDLSYGIVMLRMRAKNAEAEKILIRDKATLEKMILEKSRELINAHVELERTKRLSDIGTLAATVAHELRNPLAAIGMAAHNIKRKANNPDLDKHILNIDKKVAESDQIINNLLYYSRIKPPHYEKADIHDILEELIESLQSKREKEISVVSNIDSVKNMTIELDPTQIKEVFVNILNNAYDAIDSGKGVIEIVSEAENRFIKFTFKDNGAGMDEDTLKKVFDPFFTTKPKGTGLGLSVCRQIVDFHEGSISIESNPGQGTVVIVRLPKERKNK